MLTEAARLIRKRPDARPEIVQGFANGLFAIAPPDADDLAAIATIMRPYEDAGRQLADAALAHLAEREGIRTVFTLDGRDFSNIRLNRNRSLRLVPNMP